MPASIPMPIAGFWCRRYRQHASIDSDDDKTKDVDALMIPTTTVTATDVDDDDYDTADDMRRDREQFL